MMPYFEYFTIGVACGAFVACVQVGLILYFVFLREKKMSGPVSLDSELAHGVEDICWNSVADGWQLSCLCGWNSGASKYVERIGQEFDQHMREEGALK